MDQLKRFFPLTIIFLCLSWSAAFSQEVITSVDFEDVDRLDVVERVISIDKVLSGVISACECFSASIRNAGEGKPAEIKIVFNPQGYSGKVKEQIWVIAEDGALYTIEVMANVRP